MLQTTRTTKSATIQRTLSVQWNAEQNCVEATVCECHHKKTKSRIENFTCYFLRTMEADFGTAVEVEKRFHAGEVYHVHTDRHGTTCDCPGWTYRGQCRHLEMVVEAKRLGLL